MYKNGRRLFSWEEPPPLQVPGRSEFSLFPERLILAAGINVFGESYVKTAVYVPDLDSLQPDDEWGGFRMWFLSVNDKNAEILLQVSLAGDWMAATKFFGGRPVARYNGDERWDEFFGRVSRLPILIDEQCVVTRS